MQMKRQYRARNGAMQWKPSIQLVMLMNEANEGFCLACGEEQGGVEPDARQYKCAACGAFKVYGAEELVAMGLCYDADR